MMLSGNLYISNGRYVTYTCKANPTKATCNYESNILKTLTVLQAISKNYFWICTKFSKWSHDELCITLLKSTLFSLFLIGAPVYFDIIQYNFIIRVIQKQCFNWKNNGRYSFKDLPLNFLTSVLMYVNKT